jgi:hypothetical protein
MTETALRHGALVYDGDHDYVERAVPFLREGLEAGDGAVVAGTRSTLALAREALGADTAAVTFVDVSSAYTRPARTLAAYHDVFADSLSRHSALRAVADVQFAPHPGEWDLWTTYEAVFNRSFAHLPAWVVCTYAGAALPDRVREGVLRTHTEVGTPEGYGIRRFEGPDLVVRALEPVAVPLTALRAIPSDGATSGSASGWRGSWPPSASRARRSWTCCSRSPSSWPTQSGTAAAWQASGSGRRTAA